MANDKYDINSSQFLEAIKNYEQGFFSGPSISMINSQLNDNGASVDDYLYYNALAANMNYTRTRNEGSSMDFVLAESQKLTGLNLMNMYANSNAAVTDTGKVSLVKGAVSATQGATAGSFTLAPLTASTATSIVFSEIPAAIAAVGTGTQLGVALDGLAYNTLKAMDQNPPYYLNPDNWANICKEDNSLGMQTLRFLCGIDSNDGTVQGYITQEAFANLAYWQKDLGWYDDSYNAEIDADPEVVATIDPGGMAFYPPHVTNQLYLVGENGTESIITTTADVGLFIVEQSSNPPDAVLRYPELGPRRVWAVGSQPFTTTTIVNGGTPTQRASQQSTFTDPITGLTRSLYYINDVPTGQTARMASSSLPYRANTSTYYNTINQVILLYYLHGNYIPAGDRPEGITTQPGVTLPNVTAWDSPDNVLIYLQQNYPQFFDPTTGSAIEVPAIQSDGTIENIVYVPIAFPLPIVNYTDNSTEYSLSTNGTQGDTEIDLNNSDSKLTNELLKCILSQLNTMDPYISLDANFVIEDKREKEEDEEEEEEAKPEDILICGSGHVSKTIKQITAPCALFKLYHLTDSELNRFGDWLWDSSVLGALRDLIQDPLSAIIGLHKINILPDATERQIITVGKLASGVEADAVLDTTVLYEFGTVDLPERYGNVFDYDPYTSVQIFLPFIGTVPLNIADVMRGTIGLRYHIDLISGSVLAELYVTRDFYPLWDENLSKFNPEEAGGSIYQFTGNMASQYPIISYSYLNMYSTLISVASTVAIGAAGAAMGTAAGATEVSTSRIAVNTAQTAVARGIGTGNWINAKRSGNLVSNYGAMGCKVPYLIVTYPQVAMDAQDDSFHGVPSNEIVTLAECSGYTRVKEVKLKLDGAYQEEYDMVENLLKTGIII